MQIHPGVSTSYSNNTNEITNTYPNINKQNQDNNQNVNVTQQSTDQVRGIIYMANSGDDTVSVIRTSDKTVIENITVEDAPDGIEFAALPV